MLVADFVVLRPPAHELMLETVELSLKEAEEVLKKNVTQDDHARLAQDLLAELAKALAASSTSRSA